MKHNIYYTIAATVFLIVTMLPVHAQVTPNDPGFIPHQEYLRVVKADEAWSQTTGNPSQPISIIGLGGVDIFHEDLIARDIDFTSVRDFPDRTFINLTPITGIVGAATNNSTGIAGVNWQSPLKVHDIAVEGSFQQGSVLVIQESAVDDLISTATYTDNSRLLYMPFNWSGSSNPIELDTLKIDYPFNIREIVEGFRSFLVNSIFGIARSLIQAPGSDWNNALQTSKAAYLNGSVIVGKMADYDGVFTGFPASLGADRISISVGALDEFFEDPYQFSSQPRADRARAGFSDIDVAAPGQNIYSTVVSSDPSPYTELTGTAYAGSIVTGGVSLMQDVNPNLEPDDVKEILRRTSFDVGAPGYDPRTGFGRVDIKKAVNYAKNRTFTRGTAAVTSTTKIDDNRWVTLFNGVWGDLASGTYIVDVYEAKAEIPLPVYGESDVWFRAKNTLGWSAANPNYQSRFATVEMDPSRNVAVLTTYVYKIESNVTGQSLNVWRPADLNNAQIAYTIATKPNIIGHDVTFSSNTTISENTLYKGDIYIEDDVTVTVNAQLGIQKGDVHAGRNVEIIVSNTGRLIAEGTADDPVRFTYRYPSEWPGMSWYGIRLNGGGNVLKHSVIEYSRTSALNIRSRNNLIKNSTLKKNREGIYSYKDAATGGRSSFKILDSSILDNLENGVEINHANAAIEYSEISRNGDYGIFIYSGSLGDSDQAGGYFRRNDIHHNGIDGVYLISGNIYDGLGSTKGENKIHSNTRHEVFVDRSTETQWHQVYSGGSNSSIFDSNTDNYLLYNTAFTIPGENYLSTMIWAENNYWGSSSGPSSSDFWGSVDYVPYLSNPAFQQAGPRTATPIQANPNQPSTALLVMSAGMSRAYTANSPSPETATRRLWIEQRLIETKNAIAEHPREKSVARQLNSLYYLWRELPEEAQKQRAYVQRTIKRYRDAYWQASQVENKQSSASTIDKSDRPVFIRPDTATALSGQMAMVVEINHKLMEGDLAGAEQFIEDYTPFIRNLDMRRELLFSRLKLYEQRENYEECLKLVQRLKEINQMGINPKNGSGDLEHLEAIMRTALTEQQSGRSDGAGTTTATARSEVAVTLPEKAENDPDIPTEFALSPAFPNPFNPSTQVPFALPEAAEVRVEVYSITGRLVAVLANGRFDAGRHTLAFNAGSLASGVYLVRARLGEQVQTRKITLVK